MSTPHRARHASTGGPGRVSRSSFFTAWAAPALTWSPYVERLLGRDLYAIDTIGDVGRSQQRAAIEDTAGLARWLADTLTGADSTAGHLVGTSSAGSSSRTRRVGASAGLHL